MTPLAARLWPLDQLIQSCRHEQVQAQDGPACFELLRRALEQNDAPAWQAFDTQFRPLLRFWVHKDAAHYGMPGLDEQEVEELLADALARFIERYARLRQLSESFTHIGAVLNVLHKCIRSTVQEQRRQRERATRLESALQEFWSDNSTAIPGVQQTFESEELRRCIQTQLVQDVPEQDLQFLLHLRFALDLKPREISAQYPEQFPNAALVHQQIERLMKRLRRRVDIYVERCL